MAAAKGDSGAEAIALEIGSYMGEVHYFSVYIFIMYD